MATNRLRPYQRYWHYIDAEGIKIGRLSTYLSLVLQGKHKPGYCKGRDTGDNVVVVNAEKLIWSGELYYEKLYKWHTGYPGGLRKMSPYQLGEVKGRPNEILWRGVKKFLPKNKLRLRRLDRLFVYQGPEHDKHDVSFTYTKQLPRTYDLERYFK